MSVYLLLKWLHIMGVAIGFGSNLTHFFWLIAANRDPINRANILRLVKKIDDFMSVPAYAIGIACGVAMWLWKWPTETPWIILSLILTTILTVMGISFGPFMHRWIKLAKDNGPSDETVNPSLQLLAKRLTIWWACITLTVIPILYLMVWKPVLW